MGAGQKLNPGQYTFPFTFRLPVGLPGTFRQGSWEEKGATGGGGMSIKGDGRGYQALGDQHHHHHHENIFYKGEVIYSLEAEADAREFMGDVKHRQYLTIYPTLQKEIKSLRESKTANVNFCCCINKGSATMTVHANKNCYVPGETAQIICEAKNDSSVDFTAIRVRLKRRLTLRAHGHNHSSTITVVESRFEGIKANTDSTGEKARQVPIQLVDMKGGSQLVPETMGRLVECKYWVEVEYDIPYCPDIQIVLPLTIYAPQPAPGWAIAAPPSFWNPDPRNVMQPQVLSIGGMAPV
jgi:hypothetical protein